MHSRTTWLAVLAAVTGAAFIARAQDQTAPQAPKEFEVASIKPADPLSRQVRIGLAPGGRFTATGVTLKMLIQQAYQIKEFQISGGPGWMSSDRYEVIAKAEGAAGPNQIRPMLQALLADRFKLSFHRETKEMPVYELVVAKNGPKLQTSTAGQAQIRMGRGTLTAQKTSLNLLANNLSQNVGRVVIDKTGLTGDFDIKLEWTPEDGERMGPPRDNGETPPSAPAPGLSIFTALQEQLGLKLEARKGPVEILVIDRAEKPSEN